MSTLSSANVTDVNLVLKERTHMRLCINMLIFTHNLGNWLIGLYAHSLTLQQHGLQWQIKTGIRGGRSASIWHADFFKTLATAVTMTVMSVLWFRPVQCSVGQAHAKV